jgi:putative flippase GtrA
MRSPYPHWGGPEVPSSAKGRAVFVSFAVDLYRRFGRLIHELAKFGSVGAIAFVITTGTANLLHGALGVGPLTSNGIATVIATTFAYFANRYWTFRHRDSSGLGREYGLFFLLNGIGLVITEVFIGFTHYVLDQRSLIAFNIAQIIGTGVATLFRYWSYKRWVFLPATLPSVDPHTGLPEAAEQNGSRRPDGRGGSDRSDGPERSRVHGIEPNPAAGQSTADFTRVR